jgi:nucleotide-binding universal stress UspA family protein
MFNRILVPLDRSEIAECVFPHLNAITKAFDSHVFLLTVLGGVRQDTPFSIDPLDWQIQKAEAETYLQKKASQLQDAGMQVNARVVEGKAEETILEFAGENQIGLILLSSHGQSGLSGWNVSSIVQKIILRAYTSIMIVRAYNRLSQENIELEYHRLMVPLDGSLRAEIVLPIATSLARFHDAEVLLVHVIGHPDFPSRTPRDKDDLDLIERLEERNRVESLKYLKEVQERLPVKTQIRLLRKDNIIGGLHDMEREEEVDLVLLSAHGHSGESRWPYGSVGISFIAYGTSPLLIVQDMSREQMGETEAEAAARQQGRR